MVILKWWWYIFIASIWSKVRPATYIILKMTWGDNCSAFLTYLSALVNNSFQWTDNLFEHYSFLIFVNCIWDGFSSNFCLMLLQPYLCTDCYTSVLIISFDLHRCRTRRKIINYSLLLLPFYPVLFLCHDWNIGVTTVPGRSYLSLKTHTWDQSAVYAVMTSISNPCWGFKGGGH